MAAESNLWSSTRPRLIEAGFFVQRIETSTGEGVPDVWVGWDGGYSWIENKAIYGFPLQSRSHVFGNRGLRTEQINWMIEATRKGVRAFIWAGVGHGARRQSFLVPSTEAERFNLLSRTQLEKYLVPIQTLPEALKNGVSVFSG